MQGGPSVWDTGWLLSSVRETGASRGPDTHPLVASGKKPGEIRPLAGSHTATPRALTCPRDLSSLCPGPPAASPRAWKNPKFPALPTPLESPLGSPLPSPAVLAQDRPLPGSWQVPGGLEAGGLSGPSSGSLPHCRVATSRRLKGPNRVQVLLCWVFQGAGRSQPQCGGRKAFARAWGPPDSSRSTLGPGEKHPPTDPASWRVSPQRTLSVPPPGRSPLDVEVVLLCGVCDAHMPDGPWLGNPGWLLVGGRPHQPLHRRGFPTTQLTHLPRS